MVHNHKIQVILHYVGHSVRQNGCTIDTGLIRFSYYSIQFIIKEIEFNGNGNEIKVELDTKITPKLRQEGVKRELVRFINNLRKDAGMTIEDRAIIYWQSNSKENS